MKRTVRLLILLTIISLSCNFLTGGAGFAEVTGPILAVVPAASLDEGGEIIGQAYSFTPTAPQITVIVQMNELDQPATLTVTWYSVTDEGDVALFEHNIQVDSLERAYSIGENPGLLASGTYKAVATLGDATQTVTWVVEGEAPELAADTVMDATASGAQSAAPASGANGIVPRDEVSVTTSSGCPVKLSISQAPPMLAGYGQVTTENTGLDPDVCLPFGEMEIMAWVGNHRPKRACSFEVLAVANPPPASPVPFAWGSCAYNGNPCDLDGGSDRPGTTVNVSLRQKQSGQALAQTSTTLAEDRVAPRVSLITTPSNGVKVEPGWVIELTGIAEELKAAGWQEGVSRIDIIVMEPVVGGGTILTEKYPEMKGISCKDESLTQKTEPINWKVPTGLKKDILICAFAEDFAYPVNVGKDCAIFHPGPKWTGTIKSETTGDYGSAGICISEAWELQFSVVVSEDGTASGSGDGHLVSMPQCSGAGFDGSELATQAKNVSFDVEGTYIDGDGFELEFYETFVDGASNGLYNYSLIVGLGSGRQQALKVPLVSDKAALGENIVTTFTEGSGAFTATAVHTVTMDCTTCEEGIVSLVGLRW